MDEVQESRSFGRWTLHRCLDGPASTMEKPCGALWGMVAKHRIPSRIQAQGGASGVRRDALEIASSEPLNTRLHGNTKQIYKAYKA